MTIDMPSKEQISEVALRPYSDEEIEAGSNLEDKIENLLKFFGEENIDYDRFLNSDKIAYPNYDFRSIPGQHDTRKWIQTVRDIYNKESQGIPRVQAIRQVTASWHIMETFDFLNWLRFYEEGAHLKYKVAQLWYETGSPGYYFPVKHELSKEPTVPGQSGHDVGLIKDTISEDAERKRTIEKQRQKLISRLNSAEKLLCSPEGQTFAGKELEVLMEAIYALKKKIQLINKKSASIRLYEDMIVREANMLHKRGFITAAETLHTIAQDALLQPPSPDEPERGTGAAGGLPSMGPGMPQNPPESAPNETSVIPKSPAISKFLEGLETSKLTVDEESVDDELEVEDIMEVIDANDLLVEAQEITPTPVNPETTTPLGEPPPVAEEEPLEVMEEELPPEKPKAKDFDQIIDVAFANVSIEDVVNKLEDLSKIYKTREIPRQLAIVDMMLDSLGLASFFPSLSEASNKAIESNNYISTRIEDIISKLRGTMETRDIELGKKEKPLSPEMKAFRQNLQEQEEQEKTRKQMKKELGTKDMAPAAVPQIEIGEELGKAAPVLIPAPAGSPIAPTLLPPPA